MLEYFSSTHGARKGLADTALKTADSGYLTRKLADVAQNVVITMEDCGTTLGVTKGIMYKGDEVDRPLSDGVRGRVSRAVVEHPTTREPIVHENEMITPDKAKELEKVGLDKIIVRSPMTCQGRPLVRLPVLLRDGPGDRGDGRGGDGGRDHRRPVDRRAGHAAHDADVPHRRRQGPRRGGRR